MADKFLEALEKSVSVVSAADAANTTGWINTGSFVLNWAISNRFGSRGWPLGHVAELYGDESTGKSFLLLRAIAEVQRAGGVAVLDDSEHRFNAEWSASKLGVDVEALMYKSTDTIEAHHALLKGILDAVEKTKEDRPVLCVLDSLGILSTEKEQADEFDTRDLTRAYNIRKLFRLMTGRTKGKKYAYLVANHQYTKIGAKPFEKQKESSGGGGFKYQSSVRLSLRTPKKVKGEKGQDLRGVIIRAVVEKNSIAIPFREASIMIPFDRPLVPHSGLVAKLLELGYLDTASNHNLVWQGEDTGIPGHKTDLVKQDESAVALLEKYPDLLEVVDADLAAQEQVKQ